MPTVLKTRPRSGAPTEALTGPLAGLSARGLQVRGRLSVVGLFRERPLQQRFARAMQDLRLVKVHTYGTVELENRAAHPLVVPMHIGFFQRGAQNHATSQVHLLAAGESRVTQDCFCIQESQGGLLARAEQRFLVLPLGLRTAAFQKRGVDDYARLWEDIDAFTRRYGIKRGGHFERFLRPFFSRLLPLRHGFEPVAEQVGAAWFVDGALTGVEVLPDAINLEDMLPVFAIYGYGPAALLREVQEVEPPARRPLDLHGLRDVDDLAERLRESRFAEGRQRCQSVRALAARPWTTRLEREELGSSLLTLESEGWTGQLVRRGQDVVYASLFKGE